MIEKTEVDHVTSSRGAQWAGAGSLIGIAAATLLGSGCGRNGGVLGNLLGGGCAQQDKELEQLRSALALENAKNYANSVAIEAYQARSGLVDKFETEFDRLRERATVVETEAKCRDAFFVEHDKRRDLEVALAIKNALDPVKLDVQRNADSILMLDERTKCALEHERQARCAADNAIVDYVNCTFYPKMVADVTTGTETTPQTLRNPLPCCGGCGTGRGCGR